MLSTPPNLMDEDKAVTTLLQIDSKEQQDLNIWQQKKANKVENRVRRYSFHKVHPNKHNNHNKIPHQAIDHLTNSQYHYHQTPIKFQQPQSATMNPQEQSNQKKLMSKSTAFNQLEYWQSKMNWMAESQKKQHSSQPRLTKKLSFSNEPSNRKSNRHINRYGDDPKTKNQQYKVNLIYSLLTHRDVLQNKNEGNPIKIIEKPPQIKNKPQSSLKKINSKQLKLDPPPNLNNQMQNYMRETLKKIYLKNKNDQYYSNSQSKHSEQQRSSMIRQILINLQNIKDNQNTTFSQPNVKQNKQSNYQIDLVSDKGMQQIISSSRPQRLLYHHQPNQRHILNLNLQAEKVYKSRSINQTGIKKTLLKMQ